MLKYLKRFICKYKDHDWITYAVSTGYWSYDIEQAGYCRRCGFDTHGEYEGWKPLICEEDAFLTNDIIIIYITILLASPFLGAFIGRLSSKKHRGTAMMLGAIISTSAASAFTPILLTMTIQ